ncbi:MAG: sulfotransferase [Actinobacteria bacterium]|nr:sulfotransferase [Actinomycetota bacterium]
MTGTTSRSRLGREARPPARAAAIRDDRREHLRWLAFRAAVNTGQALARPTAAWRTLPDFVIVGAQRCGTTSLYRHLREHPQVRFPRATKGTHWFDEHGLRPESWYRANFPLERARRRAAAAGAPMRVGEACPYYLFHPSVPAWMADALPGARLIVLLRDPVERAWSQYRHEVARGYETLPFADALDAEAARLAGADAVLEVRGARHESHQHHSYVARGRYAEQLQRVWSAFPRDRVLVAFSADLEREPVATLGRITDFLDLPPLPPIQLPRWNQRPPGGVLDQESARRIRAAVEESDAWLAEHLEEPPPWLG